MSTGTSEIMLGKSAERLLDELNAIALGVFDDGLVIPIACDPWRPYHTNTACSLRIPVIVNAPFGSS